jgi:hypothetical protein
VANFLHFQLTALVVKAVETIQTLPGPSITLQAWENAARYF